MEPSSKIFEQTAHNTRLKKDEHMLIVMNKSTQKNTYLNHCKQIINNLKQS